MKIKVPSGVRLSAELFTGSHIHTAQEPPIKSPDVKLFTGSHIHTAQEPPIKSPDVTAIGARDV